MKVAKRIFIFLGIFIIYHVIGSQLFPVDENNYLQAPDWYPLLGFSISLLGVLIITKDNSQSKLKLGRRFLVFFSLLFLLLSIADMLFPKGGAGVTEIPIWYALMSISLPILSAVLYGNLKKFKAKNAPVKTAFETIGNQISEKRKQKEFDSLSESEQWKIQRNLQEPPHQGSVNTFQSAQSQIVVDSTEDLAVKFILETGQTSVSMIQRRLKLGYSKAASIIDHLEELGIVGPFNGSIPRVILISEEDYKRRACIVGTHQSSVASSSAPSLDYNKIIDGEEKWRKEQSGLSDVDYEMAKVDSMEGHAFERWCAELLKKNGFESVEVTQGSGDQGVDVLAKKDSIKYAIQCKCYSKDLGNKPVQEVNAGKMIYHCQIGAVMTNRYFTQGGKAAAEATGVILWDRDRLKDMIQKAQNEINII